MPETKVGRRYAQSLMDLAMEKNISVKVNDDMLLIANACADNRDLSILLKNPIINTDKKDAILKAIFGSKVDVITMSFMEIITRKGRASSLEEIARAYTTMFKSQAGIKTAFVTTAFKMDDALRSQVMALVKNAKGDNAELVEQIDKDIIGGFILRIGDVQYDASINKKLKMLKNDFDDNLYIKEY